MTTPITKGAIYLDARDGTVIMPVVLYDNYVQCVELEEGELIQVPNTDFYQNYYAILAEKFHDYINGIITEFCEGYPEREADEWYEED